MCASDNCSSRSSSIMQSHTRSISLKPHKNPFVTHGDGTLKNVKPICLRFPCLDNSNSSSNNNKNVRYVGHTRKQRFDCSCCLTGYVGHTWHSTKVWLFQLSYRIRWTHLTQYRGLTLPVVLPDTLDTPDRKQRFDFSCCLTWCVGHTRLKTDVWLFLMSFLIRWTHQIEARHLTLLLVLAIIYVRYTRLQRLNCSCCFLDLWPHKSKPTFFSVSADQRLDSGHATEGFNAPVD